MKITVLALLVASVAAAAEPRDLRRPARKKPYRDLVIEWISQDPRPEAIREGEISEPPQGSSVRYTAHLRNLGSSNSEPVMVRWFVDGVVGRSSVIPGLGAGQAGTTDFDWDATEGRHWIQCELVGREEWLTFASDALTVKLAVEKKTLAKYEAEYGSFARRMQDSLGALHASWSAVRNARFAIQGIEERLRIDDVVVYERGEGDKAVPAEFFNHPSFDLYVACDQGGPFGGFFIPAYSIGHNYAGRPGHESLFSDWGENCLWHEVAHFRGVQDFYIFPTQPGDVAKTGPEGAALEPLTLREEFSTCTMNNPYRDTRWSEYATAVIQMKRGIRRVGRCEDPHHANGHMWRHIPAEIDLQVIGMDGKPLKYVEVEVYRPVRGEDGRSRVAADARPLFSGTVDEDGHFMLGDDPFGRRKAEASRGLWILVLLKRNGLVRARYISLLDVNLAWWKDQREHALFQLVWE